MEPSEAGKADVIGGAPTVDSIFHRGKQRAWAAEEEVVVAEPVVVVWDAEAVLEQRNTKDAVTIICYY